MSTYKILGKKTPSKAKAPEIYNLIKNPSFEGRSLENWYPYIADGRGRSYATFRNVENITGTLGAITDPALYPTTWGSNIAVRFTSDLDVQVGAYMSENLNTTHAVGNAANNPHNLVPARGNKSYYIGWSQAQSTTATSNVLMRVYQYDGDKRWITWSDFNYNPGNVSWQSGNSLWHRFYSTFTTPSDCKYLSVSFSNGSTNSPWLDDIYLGEYLEYAAAPFNPDSMLDLTYLAPFDKRKLGYIGERHNSYTGRTFSGPLELLYTATTKTVISSILVNNFGKTETPYRVALLRSGENFNSLSLKSFIKFDEIITQGNSQTHIQNITLSAGDRLYVAADSGEVSFHLFGTEVS